ncbi:MAG: endonuclease MutS2 [Clostridiales bacterium]|jgi:DNA mismatch repair protein MutS2|nr:endonuclease MutS2 [Clostridiales bacterium]
MTKHTEIDAAALRVLEFYKIREMLAQKCVSPLGRSYAEELLPSVFEARILRDMRQTTDAEGFIIRNGTPPLGGFHDIRGALKRVELDAILNPAELLHIAAVLRTVRSFLRYGRDAGRSDKGIGAGGGAGGTVGSVGASGAEGGLAAPARADPDGVAALIQTLTDNQRLENHIGACILNEEELADDASPALLSIRRHIRKLQDSIKDKLNAIIRSPAYQKFMQDSLVTMRQDRYVIPVKQEHRAEISGLVHDMSSSGATVFIEPMAVVETNNEIREQKGKESLEIERILSELTAEVYEMLPELVRNVETLGLLDFLFAKAKLSLDYDGTPPELGPAAQIRIKKGRHPLLARGTAVPLDYWMDPGVDTVIVTGPNTGGKTVALKTVGLFTLMAQAGLHIPAASGSSLRIFAKVFADIGDEQSIEQSLSTFSSHMGNIVRILREADDETLALFDEIGAGTDPTEGAAIATSILECLHQTGVHTVATTHYSELKLYALTTPGVENACCEFDVATLRPTYKLLIGLPGKSNAFAISARLGLPEEVLTRAREFLTREDLEFEEVLHTIEKNRTAAEEARRAAEAARLEIAGLRDELDREKRAVAAQKETALREARESARRFLAESRAEAEEILARLRKLEEEGDADARRRTAAELRNKFKSKLDGVEGELAFSIPPRQGYVEPPKNLKPGDTVELVNLGQRGTVTTPPDKAGNALIRVGILSITAHVSNLRFVDEQKEQAAASRRGAAGAGGGGRGPAGGAPDGGGAASRTLGVRAELDLRGTRLEEAVAQVDRYLDETSFTGLNEVTIIHGKGTGALRAGIQQFLRGHPKAKGFRNGNYGEGDMGVTIVSLK